MISNLATSSWEEGETTEQGEHLFKNMENNPIFFPF